MASINDLGTVLLGMSFPTPGLLIPVPEADKDKVLIPAEQSRFLLKTSFTAVFCVATAFWCKQWLWVGWSLSHLLCSINHWRDGRYGSRRYMDMTNIAIGAVVGFIQLVLTCTLEHILPVLFLQALGLCFYMPGVKASERGDHVRGARLHAIGLHGLCNAANSLFFYQLSVCDST